MENGYNGSALVDDEDEDTRPESLRSCRSCLRHHLFIILLLIGIGIGIGMGLGIRYNHPEFTDDPRNIVYLEFPGRLMLRMLKVIIIPLVAFSIIHAVGSLTPKVSGKIGGYAVLYYMITTLMAVLLGMLLVATIQPGYRGSTENRGTPKGTVANGLDSFLDLIRNAFPPNILEACFTTSRTMFDTVEKTLNKTFTNATGTFDYTSTIDVITDIKVSMVSGTNTLGIIVFSCVFGAVMARLGDEGQALLDIFGQLQKVIIGMVTIIIWFTPFGLIFLVAAKIVSMENPEEEFAMLGWYIMTVLVGLAIHAFVVLPLIYIIFTRKNPFALLLNMGQALLTALGTASSSVTMPVTLKCLEENAGVNPKVSEFMIPLGATINMDGTALYEAVASIFIAQTLNMELDATKYVIISLTATAAAIGAAGIPEAGLVTMLIVLQAIGIEDPDTEIALIIAVDWFLDRCRTTINVWGDSIGAGVVERLTKRQLAKAAAEEEEAARRQGDEKTGYDDNHMVYKRNGTGYPNSAYLTDGVRL